MYSGLGVRVRDSGTWAVSGQGICRQSPTSSPRLRPVPRKTAFGACRAGTPARETGQRRQSFWKLVMKVLSDYRLVLRRTSAMRFLRGAGASAQRGCREAASLRRHDRGDSPGERIALVHVQPERLRGHRRADRRCRPGSGRSRPRAEGLAQTASEEVRGTASELAVLAAVPVQDLASGNRRE